jgi:hypothetical protein
MANVEIPYQPGLTAAQAMTIFAERFRGKYKISKTRQRKRDFAVKKNWSTAVSVGLRQESGTTGFIVTECGSSPVPGVLTAVGVVTIVLFWKYLGNLGVILLAVVETAVGVGLDRILFGAGRKALESEVVAFVENAGDLWAQGSPSLPSPGAVMPSAHVGAQPTFCTSCGAPLEGQARFCQVCGTPVPIPEPERRPSCTACGRPLAENARFCQACGAPVPLAGSEAVHAGPDQLYCPQCGTQVPQSSLFCHKCGAEVASAKRGNVQIIGAASKPTSETAIRRGYCQRCGQELGVDEKVRGLAIHERCPAPIVEAPAATPATDTIGGDRSAATAPAAPDASVGGPSPTRGYCEVCGQELGVKEKMRGLASHERCAAPTSEAITASSVSEPLEAQPATTASPVPVPEPGPKVPGRCDLCGEELGVDEKLMRLAVHQTCPTPVAETRTVAPAQAGQVCCTECGTPMPASSRFCHKCGSAVVAAAE